MSAKVSANAIISAYTGVFVGSFDDLRDYAARVLGREVYQHELSDREFMTWLRGRVEPDFIALGEALEGVTIKSEVIDEGAKAG